MPIEHSIVSVAGAGGEIVALPGDAEGGLVVDAGKGAVGTAELWADEVVAAGATVTSVAVAVEGRASALVFCDVDQPHDRRIEVSHDGASWYRLEPGGLNGAVNADGVPAGSYALAVAVAGAGYVRLVLGNDGAAAATVSAHLGVR